MATVERTWADLDVPFAMTAPDRVPKERYYDADFFALEAEQLWPRVWQMACRLEEIPEVGDAVEYQNLDQSVIVVRAEEGSGAGAVRAFQNACRHRGVKLVDDRADASSGFTCPFHGWCYGLDGANTFVSRKSSFAERNLDPANLALVPVRCETWGGWAFVNLDDEAPPLRESIEPFATILDAWQVADTRAEWWASFTLPVNWKVAEAAFLEQYHVIETHPQLVIPARFLPKGATEFDQRAYIDAQLENLHALGEGMAGMVHANDLLVADGLRDVRLPEDPAQADAAWEAALNDAVVDWHRARGASVPDLNALVAEGVMEPMVYCFPHLFVLPQYSSASSYRFRPLGPEQTLMEIWSLTRYPEGDEPPSPPRPEPVAHDDPRVPPIPIQDFSNLPRQQQGLHAQGFEYLRLSEGIEGGVANFERLVDGYLAGLSHEQLAPALREINLNPLERPVVDLGF